MSDVTGVDQNSKFSNMDKITKSDIVELILYFAKNTYSAKSETSEARAILERCTNLMKRDYRIVTVNNNNGELCSHYPSQLPILEHQNIYKRKSNINARESTKRATNTIYENIYDAEKVRDIFNRAKFARCRSRFPIPVILYKGKYICRSSTLCGGKEIYGRAGLNYLFSGSSDTLSRPSDEEVDDSSKVETISSQSDWQLFDKVRNYDIKLLKKFNVGTIVDLMVENKKVKYGIYVSSSEKVDKEKRYCDFNLISMPYPGCEFFKKFRDNMYCPEALIFDWNPNMCDAIINIPDNPNLTNLNIEWNNYKQWDLVTITANYIKYLLKYFQDDSSGMLIHCISGWDRTPLYISMLRMSLWADGLIHQSLNEFEILYLTLAYDWMLFGHRLSNRLQKGEDIFFFCFAMLKYINSKDFSIAPPRYKIKKILQKMDVDDTDSTITEDSPMDQDIQDGNLLSPAYLKSEYCQQSGEQNGNSSPEMYWVAQDTIELGESSSPKSRTSITDIPAKRIKRVDSSITTSSVQSSNSISSDGSWQVVTGTGSIKSFDTSSSCSGDTGSSVDDEMEAAVYGINRTDKLEAVRELFYGSFFTATGHETFGPETTLGQILSGIAEKMGLIQRSNKN